MKRIIAVLLTFVFMFLCFCGCGKVLTERETQVMPEKTDVPIKEQETTTRSFQDDTGRTIEIPMIVSKIAITGPLTQIYMISLAPEMMVGSSNDFSVNAEKYLKKEILDLPALGQLYGGKGTMDLEALLAADPDIVVDIGEPKDTMADDFDALEEQTGIPFLHINATVDTAADSYRKLGALLGCEEKAEKLATFLDDTLSEINSIMEKVDKDGRRANIIYCLGDKGLNVLANGSFHAETLSVVGNNIAEVSEVSFSGDGNEVDMEQIMLWDPDVIIFGPDSYYLSAGTDPIWKNLKAISEGKYYETPSGPYGWLQSPPAVQRYLGLMWLTEVLYPEYCTFNLQDKVAEYYSLFYDYELSQQDYDELTKNALN